MIAAANMMLNRLINIKNKTYNKICESAAGASRMVFPVTIIPILTRNNNNIDNAIYNVLSDLLLTFFTNIKNFFILSFTIQQLLEINCSVNKFLICLF